jgi:hypothetical protein
VIPFGVVVDESAVGDFVEVRVYVYVYVYV